MKVQMLALGDGGYACQIIYCADINAAGCAYDAEWLVTVVAIGGDRIGQRAQIHLMARVDRNQPQLLGPDSR